MAFRKCMLYRPPFFQRPQMLRTPAAFYGQKDTQPDDPKCKHFEHEQYTPLTMDDMPVPIYCWKEYHAKRNRVYNAVFAFGLISLIGSIICVKETMFFNACPPPYPFDEEETN